MVKLVQALLELSLTYMMSLLTKDRWYVFISPHFLNILLLGAFFFSFFAFKKLQTSLGDEEVCRTNCPGANCPTFRCGAYFSVRMKRQYVSVTQTHNDYFNMLYREDPAFVGQSVANVMRQRRWRYLWLQYVLGFWKGLTCPRNNFSQLWPPNLP